MRKGKNTSKGIDKAKQSDINNNEPNLNNMTQSRKTFYFQLCTSVIIPVFFSLVTSMIYWKQMDLSRLQSKPIVKVEAAYTDDYSEIRKVTVTNSGTPIKNLIINAYPFLDVYYSVPGYNYDSTMDMGPLYIFHIPVPVATPLSREPLRIYDSGSKEGDLAVIFSTDEAGRYLKGMEWIKQAGVSANSVAENSKGNEGKLSLEEMREMLDKYSVENDDKNRSKEEYHKLMDGSGGEYVVDLYACSLVKPKEDIGFEEAVFEYFLELEYDDIFDNHNREICLIRTGISTDKKHFSPGRKDVYVNGEMAESKVEINDYGYPNVLLSDCDMLDFIKDCDDSKVYCAIGDDPKSYVTEFMDKSLNCYKEINSIRNKLAMDTVQ